MMISINDPVGSTYIFIALFLLVLALSIRKKTDAEFLSIETTQELKGLAILAVVFSHIGYFLVSDHRFLDPLTIAAGVGVNLFLFLSGYGLVISSVRKNYPILQFYKRRLLKLYIPLWLVLALFFLLDFLVLKHSFGVSYVFRSFLGFFPRADLYLDINSPLWFFSFIIFYYLIFPLVFIKKQPWLSALIIYLITYAVLQANPGVLSEVLHLYRVHTMAFPLGMLLAYVYLQRSVFSGYWQKVRDKLAGGRSQSSVPPVVTDGADAKNVKSLASKIAYLLAAIIALSVAGYTAYHSNVGTTPRAEELTSLVTVAAITAFFILAKFENRFLYLIGVYSYEIYLLHWPIMYHYDLLYRSVPAWLATCLYLALFLLIGKAMSLATKKIG
jgi:peptidoglycan/LPS O-acetylase OafA/YrhL